ncbi:MAG: ABC transporter permease [bacterium]|nr:MAG: ABC transporter permease [bacterium]
MLINYLKIALRNLIRQKMYSFINIFGLAVGLACSILILAWVKTELNYDKFHKHFDEIYRLISYGTKYMVQGFDGTPAPLAPAITEQIPEIMNVTRFMDLPRMVVKYSDKSFYESRAVLTDPSIFDVFTFSLIMGNKETVLADPSSVIITEATATKYFGNDKPLGKILSMDEIEMKVSGVMKNVPQNSHLKFDFLVPISLLEKLGNRLSWGNFSAVTYLHLSDKPDIGSLAERITEIASKNNCPQVADGVSFRLQPLSEIHLDARHGGYRNYSDMSDKMYVSIFSAIAFFILFLACINYVNLATARTEKRVKEIGMRKVVGASRRQLIFQYLGESILLSILSLALALILVELLQPVFNNLVQKQLDTHYFSDQQHIIGLLGILFITGVLSGIYPALFLSSFNPIKTIKSNTIILNRNGSPFLRRALVIFQFTLSIILMIGTIVIHKQLHFMKNKNLGFEKENVIYLPLKENIANKYDFFKQQLLQNPEIINVTATDFLWATNINRTTGFDWEGKDPQFEIDMLIPRVGFDYFETLKIEMAEGRSFSREFQTDATEAFILNEEAVRQMGITSPVGKHFTLYRNQGIIQKGKIIGVFKDIYYKTLSQQIEPLAIRVLTDLTTATSYGVVLIRISGKNIQNALALIENLWQDINASVPFEYHFLDETYENLYLSETRMGTIMNYFSLLAIIISCLGLFALATYAAERKTREIGIRKILGSSVVNIVILLTKEFTKLVIIANIIAWPIGYYFMNKWLQDFAYRVNFGIEIFVWSSILAFSFALLTVSFQSIKAALVNPVESLRYE